MSVQVDDSKTGITFAVHDVLMDAQRLPKSKAYEHVRRMLKRKIESCSDYHTDVCEHLNYQPLLAAVYTAYSLHLPLKLTPDAVWLTIAQGVAHHMAIHGETLRDRFVRHSGKVKLNVEIHGWAPQSPENPWDLVMEGWTDQIKEHVGDSIYDCLRCDFSTTDRASYVASLIVMMDIFETYFKYEMYAICGLPRVTLAGSTEDWDRLVGKVEKLRCFEIDWWLEKLLPLVEEMARARRGIIDTDHWRNICKLEDAYGGSIINGWIAYFFPYLRQSGQGPCKHRNSLFETGEGFTTRSAPSGLSEVPFVLNYRGTRRSMNAVGGLIGVKQDLTTFALEPIAGWAICEATELDALFDSLRDAMRGHTIEIPISAALAEQEPKAAAISGDEIERYLPRDLGRFLVAFSESLTWTGKDAIRTVKLQAVPSIQGLDWGEEQPDCRGPGGLTWFCIAELSDGRRLAINLDLNRHLCEGCRKFAESYEYESHPICVTSPETQGANGMNPVVAMSFTELLKRLTQDSEATDFYWDQVEFRSYGDAMEFTRMQTIEREMIEKRKRKRKK